MNALVKALLFASLLSFILAGLVEWKYYLEDRRQAATWTVSKAAETQTSQTGTESSGRLETQKNLPRKLGTNLQDLVEEISTPKAVQGALDLDQGLRPAFDSYRTAKLFSSLSDPAIIVFCFNR